jgi:hypothetical protein
MPSWSATLLGGEVMMISKESVDDLAGLVELPLQGYQIDINH